MSREGTYRLTEKGRRFKSLLREEVTQTNKEMVAESG